MTKKKLSGVMKNRNTARGMMGKTRAKKETVQSKIGQRCVHKEAVEDLIKMIMSEEMEEIRLRKHIKRSCFLVDMSNFLLGKQNSACCICTSIYTT